MKVLYPEELLQQHAEGKVTLDCAITETGATKHCVVVSSSDHRFDQQALASAAQLRYRPAMHDGVPVRTEHHILHLNYTIAKPPQSA